MKEFIRKHPNMVVFIIAIIMIVISFLYGFYIAQEEAFFIPNHDEDAYIILKQNDEFEEVHITSDGLDLYGWVRPINKEEKKPLLIMYLGNAQSSSNFLANGYFLDYIDDYHLLIVDYPKYGLSKGSLTEKELFKSVLGIYDYGKTLEYVDENNICVLGYSIGTGMATYVASQRNVNGLILLAPYENALNLYNDNINVFYGPLRNITRYKLESDKYAKSVKAKPLIIATKSDEVINYKHAEDLSKSFNELEKFLLLENPSHGGLIKEKEVWVEIQNYLQETLVK